MIYTPNENEAGMRLDFLASTFGVSEEKTVNKRFFKRSPTNASERCRVTQAPVHDTVVDR